VKRMRKGEEKGGLFFYNTLTRLFIYFFARSINGSRKGKKGGGGFDVVLLELAIKLI